MRRFPRSIRWRLQLWYGVMLVLILGGFGFTAFHLERAQRFRGIDEGLHGRLSTLVEGLRAATAQRREERGQRPPIRIPASVEALFDTSSGYYYVIWLPGPEVIRSGSAPGEVPKPKTGENAMRMRGDLREVFLFAAPVDCVLVGRSVSAEQSDLSRLAALLAMSGLAVLGAGLLGGWWLATRAIRPVEEISATAMRIAAGDLAQRISSSDTDSELGRLAHVLNSTFARLETAFAQQSRFTADAAHELRTPVAVMLTQTQSALARERSPTEYREILEACQRATQRMRRLIESLLELAHLDAGQDAVRRAPCDLGKIAAECVELVRPLAAAREIRISADLRSVLYQGDAERLAQVVMNLLGNAIDYNRDGGEVHISVEPRDGSILIIVRDTGIGITAEDLPHVFERFHRCDRARTSSSHSGLGLAIALAIVRAHGGNIEVVSQPNLGTTFTVDLPEMNLRSN